ncbi:MAG: phosphate ABC transporter ATP-binding protein [Candidatus Thermoplasmatota archaeon]|nr:phosphate ABC transporter ATP-binding protein [Candidatus Thermoplasmatota archaeon]
MRAIETEIKVRNLNVFYSGGTDVVALKNINIDIPKNKLTTIIGPSGCGKTTLLKTLNRLHEIKEGVKVSGEIFIGGEDIYHPSRPVPELRRKVGLVAQKPYPLPASIYDNVAYGPKIHYRPNKNELDRIVEECLRKANLWDEVKDRLDSPAADLSIGQQQRLCMARTLAVEPEVILCDEVTSALDPISSEKLENLLLSLKEKYTIVMVTHVLRQAKRLADYVIFLYLGEVVETGTAEQFFNNPTNEKTKEYIKGIMAGT